MSKTVMSIRLILFTLFVKSVDEPFDNYADIAFDDFLIKNLLFFRIIAEEV